MQIATCGKEKKITQQKEESCILPTMSLIITETKKDRDLMMLARDLGTCIKLIWQIETLFWKGLTGPLRISSS